MNQYEQEHNALLRGFGAECAVLLKSDGAFPLQEPCKLALYGSGARQTLKGGTGSGEVNTRSFVTAEAGLEAAGFQITSKNWLDHYSEIRRTEKKRFVRSLKRSALLRGTLAVVSCMGAIMPEPDYTLPLEASGEAAVYVLARISGEGGDRKPIPGDILLTETERKDILALNNRFKNFLLVLNVGGVVDLSMVPEVRNILLLSQLGSETGNILADIILGKCTPSGKLATTWAAWGDYPAIGCFGSKNDTHYKEGIYTGYRFFSSVNKQPLFPFGFGMSYTEFSYRFERVWETAGAVTVEAAVQNVGKYPGKEVLQLYVSQPRGKLDKPRKVLAAFTKTQTLSPGCRQTLTLDFDLRDLASYDTERACWILESGDYVLHLGNSSTDTRAVAVLRLDGETILKKAKNCLGTPDFSDWKPNAPEEMIPDGLPVLPVRATDFITEIVDYKRSQEVDPMIESLTDEELCLMSIGAFKRKGSKNVVGNAAKSVAGAAGETTSCLTGKGIQALVMADGPAGLRLSRQYTRDEAGAHPLDGGMLESVTELMPTPVSFAMKLRGKMKAYGGEIHEQNCTAIPIGTALAQSWNLELAEQCGDIVGKEMERFGVNLWLAPALNLHRDIRCGRNFEYFSEDPLISGRFSAALTRGVQQHPGRAVTLKHFAANNQETNRYNSNSQVSERALRELYLRGFEIAIRESQPLALMTSYNLINGVHTSEHQDLIMDILRAEFGFRGVVMTDWIVAMLEGRGNKYPGPNPAKISAAGNDLTMPGSQGSLNSMLKGLQDGLVTRKQLQINATRILKLINLLIKK
ncbi:MAG: glycoside hydrolase family 3 C-terminal domain-containing protein [Oscillospiraceae bacterium]|nr:glycoside hydrolase family 3 C-terminal domain-containing protein [Oscillospiraceae bacterium]